MGVEPEVPTTLGAPQPVPSCSEGVEAIDYANKFASGPHQPDGEGGSPHPDDADRSPPERVPTPSFTDESRASSPTPSAKPVENEGPTDFRHPAAVEEQRTIWLPQDQLGLVHEIRQELDAQDILYSTDGAEMDSKGHVSVTMAPPEEVKRNSMEVRPLPSPDEREGDDIRIATAKEKSSEGSNV